MAPLAAAGGGGALAKGWTAGGSSGGSSERGGGGGSIAKLPPIHNNNAATQPMQQQHTNTAALRLDSQSPASTSSVGTPPAMRPLTPSQQGTTDNRVRFSTAPLLQQSASRSRMGTPPCTPPNKIKSGTMMSIDESAPVVDDSGTAGKRSVISRPFQEGRTAAATDYWRRPSTPSRAMPPTGL
ncbi:hypothetical protein PLESTF_000340200 [Pleodorina starrii]|nr:hypothetical protein PLESTM_001573600 [Pleodorina starrii]GLC65789.1 hypothetical protein PLESTF_000340200 [Pleodorina starrii]